MEQNEYEVGKVYPKPDGTRWIFLGYYLEMPVWKVEGKYQTENNTSKIDLPGRRYLKFFPFGRKSSRITSTT